MPETAATLQISALLRPHQGRVVTLMKEKETGSLPQDVSIQEVQGKDGKMHFEMPYLVG